MSSYNNNVIIFYTRLAVVAHLQPLHNDNNTQQEGVSVHTRSFKFPIYDHPPTTAHYTPRRYKTVFTRCTNFG